MTAPAAARRQVDKGEELYPTAEVAQLWRCSQDTIERLIGAGRLRAVNIALHGRAKLRVPASALAEFVKKYGAA